MEERNEAAGIVWNIALELFRKDKREEAHKWLEKSVPFIPDKHGRAMCQRALSLTAFEVGWARCVVMEWSCCSRACALLPLSPLPV